MKAGDCHSFNGIQNDKCKAGVCYKTMTQDHKFDLPCLILTSRSGAKVYWKKASCDKFTEITEEEAEKFKREAGERMSFTLVAIGLCVVDSDEKKFEQGKGKPDITGDVECPKCQSRVDYARSSYNGHTRGRCRTTDCLTWIQ